MTDPIFYHKGDTHVPTFKVAVNHKCYLFPMAQTFTPVNEWRDVARAFLDDFDHEMMALQQGFVGPDGTRLDYKDVCISDDNVVCEDVQRMFSEAFDCGCSEHYKQVKDLLQSDDPSTPISAPHLIMELCQKFIEYKHHYDVVILPLKFFLEVYRRREAFSRTGGDVMKETRRCFKDAKNSQYPLLLDICKKYGFSDVMEKYFASRSYMGAHAGDYEKICSFEQAFPEYPPVAVRRAFYSKTPPPATDAEMREILKGIIPEVVSISL